MIPFCILLIVHSYISMRYIPWFIFYYIHDLNISMTIQFPSITKPVLFQSCEENIKNVKTFVKLFLLDVNVKLFFVYFYILIFKNR